MGSIAGVVFPIAGADVVVLFVEIDVELVLVRIVEKFWFLRRPMLNELSKKTYPYLMMKSIL